MTGEPLTLDDNQLSAVAIEPSARQIVLAAPGSGKTEVVAALVNHLVDERDLAPADEILVLSFSRAAVSALRRRVLHSGGTAAPAVRTLDSFASRILDDLDDEEGSHLDFDARISRATSLMRTHGLGEDVSMVAHVIVDEVQDVVGVRAELVLELLRQLPREVGFTLLGDPRQSVYNFQLNTGGGMSSVAFLDAVRGLGALDERQLLVNYRARSSEAHRVAKLGLMSATESDWLGEVRSELGEVTSAGDVSGLARPVQRWRGTTAFLCRDNGVALTVSANLRLAGLDVATRAAAEEAPVAAWVASAFASGGAKRLTRADAIARLEKVTDDPARAWRLLMAAERDFRAPDHLDLRKLAQRIATRDLPADMLGGDERVVVSTIHRAKGLEYENVVIVNPRDLLPGDVDPDEAAVAYVALTRARERIVTARCDLPRGLRKDKQSGRWIIGGFQKWQTIGFEVRAADCQVVVDNQDEGVSELTGVTAVEGPLNKLRSTLEDPVWDMMIDGRVVARTSPDFGALVTRRIGAGQRRKRPWPALNGLAVEGTETVAHGDADGGKPGLRVGVRIGGMAMLDWRNEGPHA